MKTLQSPNLQYNINHEQKQGSSACLNGWKCVRGVSKSDVFADGMDIKRTRDRGPRGCGTEAGGREMNAKVSESLIWRFRRGNCRKPTNPFEFGMKIKTNLIIKESKEKAAHLLIVVSGLRMQGASQCLSKRTGAACWRKLNEGAYSH